MGGRIGRTERVGQDLVVGTVQQDTDKDRDEHDSSRKAEPRERTVSMTSSKRFCSAHFSMVDGCLADPLEQLWIVACDAIHFL